MSEVYSSNSIPGSNEYLDEMDLSERELTLLNEVGLAATQLLDVEEILDLALDTLIQKLGMSVAMIYLLDPKSGRYTLRASYGISQEQKDEIERRRDSGQDITQQVVDTGLAIFVPDMSADSRFKGVWDDLDDRSYVKLALKSRGTVVGVLGLLTYEKQPLSPHSVEFLKAIGREIGIAIDNAILLTETKRREQQAITLYKLGMMISGSLSLSSVLESVAEASRELMQADIGLIGLVDLELQEVVLEAISGNCTKTLPGHQKILLDQPPWSDLAAGEPIQSSDYDQGWTILHDSKFIRNESVQSFLAVPLLRGNSLLGLVEVMYRKPCQLLPNDIHLLSRLANQVVLSIENARLYQQLHHLAALEERDRLARELHDHLSQGLGYLKIKSTITEDLMASGQIEKAQESLKELKKVSQYLYVDVREQIFNLRTIAQPRQGFFSSLQEYLADYRTHYGLRVDLILENECLDEFSSHVSSQLMRIIQEALTNVRRHSNASEVLIQCGQEEGQVCMCIEDNGRGFNPDQVIKEDSQHYGLKIMGERAESVGGSLEFDSQPGAGTRIILRVPAD
ncbi:MAG: GAF domain-containing protein [Anaerolineales bacterium]